MAAGDLAIIVIACCDPLLKFIDDTRCNYELCLAGPRSDGSEDSPLVRVVIVAGRALSIAAWILSERLLVYQYRKGLSEQWYSHKMFWILNAAANLGALAYSCANGLYAPLMIADRVIISSLNIALLLLLCNTKQRTLDALRPGIQISATGELITELDNGGLEKIV
jgi:hypothetical protein